MGCLGKSLALFLIVLMVMSSLILLTLKPANAQSVAKLSVPEFSVTYADNSYDVPASSTIDPFTGQSVENPAHHVVNRVLTFTIRNQEVTDGFLHYVIEMKGHFSGNWTGIYDGTATTNSVLTVWTFSTSDLSGRQEDQLYRGGVGFYLPYIGKTDFAVKAQTWGEVMAKTSPQNPFGGSITTLFAESDWSNPQTVNLSGTSASPSSSNPTFSSSSSPTPAVPEISWLTLAPLLLSLLLVAVGFRSRKVHI